MIPPESGLVAVLGGLNLFDFPAIAASQRVDLPLDILHGGIAIEATQDFKEFLVAGLLFEFG